MTFKPLDVTAYLIEEDSYLTGEFPRIEAQVRPLKAMTGVDVPGICIDIPGAGDSPSIAIEVSVLELLPALNSLLPAQEEEEPPLPEYTEDEYEEAARQCGCQECIEYLGLAFLKDKSGECC